MKILLITDQHFGVRNDNVYFIEHYKKFYGQIVIPFIEKLGIKEIINLGDTFDKRRSINYMSLDEAKSMWFDPITELGCHMTSLVGNHDIYYKNTLRINAPTELLGEYENFDTVDKPTTLNYDGLDILMLPWICEDNYDKTLRVITESEAPVCMGHLELNGFEAHRGYIMDHGDSTAPYRHFEKVFSGHYHRKSTRGNISYLGNPYQIYWNDYRDRRGFHIFDTETLELEYIQNPYEIYQKIYYNEDNIQSGMFKYHEFAQSFIKIIVEKKTDTDKFERFISQLYAAGVHEIKVIEDPSFEQDLNEEIDIEKEDTLTILERYVDDMEHSDKPALKNILKSLYVEALELV